MLSEASSYLALYLAPLQAHLKQPDVTDIYINAPGEIWIESLGGAIKALPVPELDGPALWRLAHQIASSSHQGVSRRRPLLSATLPDGSRVQIVAPPATRGPMAIAIRRHIASSLPLHHYADVPSAQAERTNQDGLLELLSMRDYPALLEQAVAGRMNIVVAGGTSAGKTTLLNSLIASIPAQERLIFIEDTPELTLSHANSVGLVAVRGSEGETQVTPENLLQATLRMRPDRIILGELRGAEAFTFLRAINTGHPGSLTTVHADTPERALTQLAMMALQAGFGIAYRDLVDLVHEMVDVVVQVGRIGGQRRIKDVKILR